MADQDHIEKVLNFTLPPDRIWRAVTDPDELSRWFSDHVTMTLEVGADITFVWDKFGTATGRIEVIDPPTKFAFRWRAHNVPEDEPITDQNSTLVTFTLSASKAGTRLHVLETGFANLPEALRARAFKENTGGWRVELGELEAYLSEAA